MYVRVDEYVTMCRCGSKPRLWTRAASTLEKQSRLWKKSSLDSGKDVSFLLGARIALGQGGLGLLAVRLALCPRTLLDARIALGPYKLAESMSLIA